MAATSQPVATGRRSPASGWRPLAVVLVGLALAGTAHAETLTGKVVGIADGDTVTLLVERTQFRVRLNHIDAPEKAQPFGQRSRDSLSTLCFGQSAQLHVDGRDRYGRVLGDLVCDGQSANAEQVRRGMAWVYQQYAPKHSPLYALQDAAQRERVGLWRDPAPVPPWNWRAERRGR